MADTLITIAKALKNASKQLRVASTNDKNQALLLIKKSILENIDNILDENQKDVVIARNNGTSEAMIDRLMLTEDRIRAIAESIDTVIGLDDPVGIVKSGKTMPNGMQICEKTVPIGVMAIIYESRPNVTVDAAVLALKSSNAMLLRGSSSAINSNKAIVKAIKNGLEKSNIPKDSIMLFEDTDRSAVKDLLRLNDYIDLVIPRGGSSLINFVVQNATVPTIETGVGNCHIYVDENADIDIALSILENGKMSRPSVCNALETLLVHKNVAEKFLKQAYEKLGERLKFYGCDETAKYIKCEEATEEHYSVEFLDYEIAVKVVENIDMAIEHIDKYSSSHSECIITNNLENANKFTAHVDSACVYVNSSTRFTDGGEFGFGCEMGISTQKLHVRGPVGLQHLVSNKYIIMGNGQIR